jgi:hypothetical protein
MDRRDEELLDKQLRAIHPRPRRQGVMIAAIVTVFFAGIALGGILFGHATPQQIADNALAIGVVRQ